MLNSAELPYKIKNIYYDKFFVDQDVNDLLESLGVEFVDFVGKFGYDKVLRVLGRHMRDFLNGLDNLHEYMRFSYQKLKPPSFFVEKGILFKVLKNKRIKNTYFFFLNNYRNFHWANFALSKQEERLSLLCKRPNKTS